MRQLIVMTICGLFLSCEDGLLLVEGGNAPIASNQTASDWFRDAETMITLNYTDADSDLAFACSVSNLTNLTESTACSCDSSGVCTVGVTGTASYYGAVSFDYTVTSGVFISNSATVSFNLNYLGSSADEEWVYVPADAGGLGGPAFFVMKYEARGWNDADADTVIDAGEVDADGISVASGTHVPVSIASDIPWRGTLDSSGFSTECSSLGANYDLISNEEWMEIARNAESVASNWTGGTVGSGCFFRGNTGEATTGTGSTLGDSCGYDGSNPEGGTGRDNRASHTLSNGNEIYDLAGNLWEWVDWDKDTAGYQSGPNTCSASAQELTAVACGALVDADYNTSNGGYTSTEGVGVFTADADAGVLRGGNWNYQTSAGVFNLHIDANPAATLATLGFRCVYRP